MVFVIVIAVLTFFARKCLEKMDKSDKGGWFGGFLACCLAILITLLGTAISFPFVFPNGVISRYNDAIEHYEKGSYQDFDDLINLMSDVDDYNQYAEPTKFVEAWYYPFVSEEWKERKKVKYPKDFYSRLAKVMEEEQITFGDFAEKF